MDLRTFPHESETSPELLLHTAGLRQTDRQTDKETESPGIGLRQTVQCLRRRPGGLFSPGHGWSQTGGATRQTTVIIDTLTVTVTSFLTI